MTLPRSVRNLLLLFPFVFLGASFLLLLLNPNELYWPYNFWGEFSRIWKKSYWFLISLVALIWLRRKGVTQRWVKAMELMNETAFLAVLLFAAALFRLAWVLWIDNQPFSDGLVYWNSAKHIAAGRGFSLNGVEPSAVTAPGYPFFLAQFVRLFGENLFPVRLSHVFLSLLVPPLVFVLSKVVFGKPTAVLAVLFMAFCPNAILATSLYMNEHVYLPVTLLALVLIAADLTRPRFWKLASAGILFGLSDLSRGVFFLFPFTLFLFYPLAGRTLRESAGKASGVLLFTALVVLPWTYRNYKAVGYPVPIGTTAGSGLYVMNSPIADPYTTQLAEMSKEHPQWVKLHPNQEVAAYLAGSKYSMEWIRSDFRRFMKLGAGKLVAFFGLNKTWTNYENTRGSKKFTMESKGLEPMEQILKYYFAFHFFWFLVGAYLLTKQCLSDDRNGTKTFILFVALFIIGMHFLFAGWPRYRYTLEPFVYVLSAFAVTRFLHSSETAPQADGTPIHASRDPAPIY